MQFKLLFVNLITVTRGVAASILALIFINTLDYSYLQLAVMIHIFGDLVDGWAARRLNACTAIGQKLDLLFDYIFIGILAYISLFIFEVRGWIVIALVATILQVIVTKSLELYFDKDIKSYRELDRQFAMILLFSYTALRVYSINLEILLLLFFLVYWASGIVQIVKIAKKVF